MTWMDVILWLIWRKISFVTAHRLFKCNTHNKRYINWTLKQWRMSLQNTKRRGCMEVALKGFGKRKKMQ